MLKRFVSFTEKENIITPGNRVLLTVSGGIDSVVMLDLFAKTEIECTVAHCNFQLRENESEDDELFVRKLAERYRMPIMVKRFDTRNSARSRGLSIQQTAREIRYEWFEQIRKELNYDSIATAHHSDDSIETFFINLARGTGINGLGGIKPRNKNIIRPLLCMNRAEIVEYVKDHNLSFREDSSNKEVKYTRNKIRHEILPLFESINPSFRNTMIGNIERLNEVSEIYFNVLNAAKADIMHRSGNSIFISIDKLVKFQYKESLLHFILSDFGFSTGTIPDIIHLITSESGKHLLSHTHRLIRDRESLIITAIATEELQKYYIEDFNTELHIPLHLVFHLLPIENVIIQSNSNVAMLDLDKMEPPVILRKWQHGDIFRPLGMSGMKKVSDFLIDHKVSIPEKEKTWVLTSGEKIVWLVGYRIDDRYKVAENTKSVLRIELTK